jgi:hypothetical protein
MNTDFKLCLSAFFHFHCQYFTPQRSARGRQGAAIELGSPKCRLSVPISTNQLSPVLNHPTRPWPSQLSRAATSLRKPDHAVPNDAALCQSRGGRVQLSFFYSMPRVVDMAEGYPGAVHNRLV